MKITRLHLLTFALVMTSLLPAFGQRQKGAGDSPVKVGTAVADVTAYLEDGTAYRLQEELKGKHAVLVFGCLT